MEHEQIFYGNFSLCLSHYSDIETLEHGKPFQILPFSPYNLVWQMFSIWFVLCYLKLGYLIWRHLWKQIRDIQHMTKMWNITQNIGHTCSIPNVCYWLLIITKRKYSSLVPETDPGRSRLYVYMLIHAYCPGVILFLFFNYQFKSHKCVYEINCTFWLKLNLLWIITNTI